MNPKINRETTFQHWGLIDYKEAWDRQEKIFKETVDLKISNRKLPEAQQVLTPNHLVFCYHPHVYTLGKSGKEENLLLDTQGLETNKAVYYKINRGGDITYHGPGQLVGYPILDLENFFTDIHKYLRFLEEAVIRTLRHYHIIAGRVEGLTGVWVGHENPETARKVCAMGVKSSRWVTMHGFALNVTTDMTYFSHIIPCGIDDKAVTSLEAETGQVPDMAEVEKLMQRHLSELFQIKLKNL